VASSAIPETIFAFILQYMIEALQLLQDVVSPHLSLWDIITLTFEAVVEVVIICFAGFMAAQTGLLNLSGQKVMSALNVDLFTPCLVFSKLAPSLSLQKMVDIVIIPIFYALSTGISYGCSRLVGLLMDLNEPEADFVTAMAVFGNSNSLPVSLTLSLAYTLPDLLWDDIDDDNPDKVASRGILYLLIFQQLGQILRWSWGYNKLLRKRSVEELISYGPIVVDVERDGIAATDSSVATEATTEPDGIDNPESDAVYFESLRTGGAGSSSTTVNFSSLDEGETIGVYKPIIAQARSKVCRYWDRIRKSTLVAGFFNFMNPPLYAMLISVVVASVPFLQRQFFTDELSFIHNTLSNSIKQLGSVSIPLILIVLGSNLSPSEDIPPASRNYSKIVIGSLLSRMILPSLALLPIITLCVKFFKVSILDDPIFLIVAFILTVSPPAIQLSQIVQLNGLYQKEMSGVLFWGYVVLTLPTTIFIVVTSLEVLDWAKA
jgi:predicted permease